MRKVGVLLELPMLKTFQWDNMISVIVPTMWKCDDFLNILKKVLEEKIVGEVIIINNSVKDTPNSELLNHEKVKMHNFPENIYVNPAWNFGAENAKYDILAFLSDDVDFDIRVFDKTHSFIQNEINSGFIGLLTRYQREISASDVYDKYFTTGEIEFASDVFCTTFGALFFMKKEHWKNIPNDIKFTNGECLQYNRLMTLKKNNYIIVNCRSESKWHVTLETIPEKMLEEDNNIFEKINAEGDWVNS